MRTSKPLQRGAKGYNWYQRFIKNENKTSMKYSPPTPFDWNKNNIKRPTAYFDIKIETLLIGRLNIELANDIVPNTVQNFVNLCEDNSKISFKGTKIHDIRKGMTIMGGDVEMKNGKGGHSSFGDRYFLDENFIIPHTSRGLISMASTGVNTNNSQFYISLNAASHLNGRSVVFGRIVDGDSVLKQIEDVS